MRFYNLHRTCRRPQIPPGSPWRHCVTWQLSWPWTGQNRTGRKVTIWLNRTMKIVMSIMHSVSSSFNLRHNYVKYTLCTWCCKQILLLIQAAFCVRSRSIPWRIVYVRRFSFEGPCAGTSLMLRKPGYVDLTVTTGAMSSVIDMSKIGRTTSALILQKNKTHS